MVQIFQLALFHVLGETHVMMGRKQETRAIPLQPFADGLDLLGRRLLFGYKMIEAENHQRIGVGKNAFVDRQLVSGLINALKDGDGMSRGFAGDLLKTEG